MMGGKRALMIGGGGRDGTRGCPESNRRRVHTSHTSTVTTDSEHRCWAVRNGQCAAGPYGTSSPARRPSPWPIAIYVRVGPGWVMKPQGSCTGPSTGQSLVSVPLRH